MADKLIEALTRENSDKQRIISTLDEELKVVKGKSKN